jgi:small subunit ribosomal protein S20
MAHSASAEKRNRQNAKCRTRNRTRNSSALTAEKRFRAAVASKNLDEAGKLLSAAVSLLDKSAKTGTLHKNTASRKKSRLAQHLAKARVAAAAVKA